MQIILLYNLLLMRYSGMLVFLLKLLFVVEQFLGTCRRKKLIFREFEKIDGQINR